MGIPACLWRRTGEIYKGNKEFASLVGVSVDLLREGRLCIYEVKRVYVISSEIIILAFFLTSYMFQFRNVKLMVEESAVNYWEVRDLLNYFNCFHYCLIMSINVYYCPSMFINAY